MASEIESVGNAIESLRDRIVGLQAQIPSPSSDADLSQLQQKAAAFPKAISDLQQRVSSLEVTLKKSLDSPTASSSASSSSSTPESQLSTTVASLSSDIVCLANFGKELSGKARLYRADCEALARSIEVLCQHFAAQLPTVVAQTSPDSLHSHLEHSVNTAVSTILGGLTLLHACGTNDTVYFLSSYWVEGSEDSPFLLLHRRLEQAAFPGHTVAGLSRDMALETAYVDDVKALIGRIAADPVEFVRESLLSRLESAPGSDSYKASLRSVEIALQHQSAEQSVTTSSGATATASSSPDEAEQQTAGQTAYIHIEPSELEIVRQIGEGAFATVHEALMAGERVAVKRINQEADAFEQLCNEVQIMNKLHSAYIVPLYGAYLQGSNAFLVMELVGRGALFDLLVHNKAPLPWPLRWSFARDVALSIYYLHSRNPPIVHRDLKSDNLLVTAGWRVKLTDFGLSIPTDPPPPPGGCGTIRWVAPEIAREEAYTTAADVYSVAIIFWEIAAREVPWGNDLSDQIVSAVTSGRRPRMPDDAPRSFTNLIKSCWDQNPASRPSIAEVARLIERENIPDNLSALMEDESLEKAKTMHQQLEEQHRIVLETRERTEKEIEETKKASLEAQRLRDDLQRQRAEAQSRAESLVKKTKQLQQDRDRLVAQVKTAREKLESEKKKADKKVRAAEQQREDEINDQKRQIAEVREQLEKLKAQKASLLEQKPSS